MKSHRIRVKVEIVECEENQPSGELQQLGDGDFELIISDAVAGSIDDCEQAVLATNYPAIRDALSKHLTEYSKKKLEKQARGK